MILDWPFFRDIFREYETRFGEPPVLNPQPRFKVYVTLSAPVYPAGARNARLFLFDILTNHPQGVPTGRYPGATSRSRKNAPDYQDWFYQHVMPPSDNDGQSGIVLVMPWTTGELDYRNKYRDEPQKFTGIGFFFYNVGSYAEPPELNASSLVRHPSATRTPKDRNGYTLVGTTP
jgi:hypothetical protein